MPVCTVPRVGLDSKPIIKRVVKKAHAAIIIERAHQRHLRAADKPGMIIRDRIYPGGPSGAPIRGSRCL